MAFIGDTSPISRQLKLTNYVETWYHVWRISFVVTILDDDEGSGAVDEVGTFFAKLSVEDQELLNWQASPENLQNDVEVRDTLTQQSGRICPYKNISTSLYDNVKSDSDTLRRKMGDRPLSAYEHVYSFRSAMLTKHSGQAEGQPEVLALHDGLGRELSFLRWRSHDFIKVSLCKPRPNFRVFWLIQWDIVDLNTLRIRTDTPHDDAGAPNQGRRRRPSSLSQHNAVMRPGANSEKFHGVRFGRKRKPPKWIAEVRRKGERKKIWLGCYSTAEEAARAADVGNHYYKHNDMLNFRDSPRYLGPIPTVLSDQDKQLFVQKEAHWLAAQALKSTWDPDNRTSQGTSTEISTELQAWDNTGNFAVDDVQLETNGTSFNAGFPGFDDVPELVTPSESDLEEDHYIFQPSTSSGATAGSSPEENAMWSSSDPTGSFTAGSHGGGVDSFPPFQQAAAISPIYDAFTCDDPFVALDIPGYDHNADTVQAERNGDWVGGFSDDIFCHWSCGPGPQGNHACN